MQGFVNFLLLTLTTVFVVSCSSDTNLKQEKRVIKPQKRIESNFNLIGKELIGKWKVDSVVIKNETKERLTSKNQIFYDFKSNSILELSEQVKVGMLGNLIGDCRLDENNDLIILKKDSILVQYGILKKGSSLILKGPLLTLKDAVFGVTNFNVRYKEKGTLIFMSKYEDPYDEEIFGPRKK